jgi:hypothetical protein
MEYIRVADIADLPANKMITVVVKGQEVLLANTMGPITPSPTSVRILVVHCPRGF